MGSVEIDAGNGVVARNGGINKARRHRPAINSDAQLAMTEHLLVMGDRLAVDGDHAKRARNVSDVATLWQFP